MKRNYVKPSITTETIQLCSALLAASTVNVSVSDEDFDSEGMTSLVRGEAWTDIWESGDEEE